MSAPKKPVFNHNRACAFYSKERKDFFCARFIKAIERGKRGCGKCANPFLFKKTIQYLTEGHYQEESPAERIKTGFRELELNVQERGEKNACMLMRKKFCAYSSGIKGGALLRKQVVSADTIEEYRRIFAVYLE